MDLPFGMIEAVPDEESAGLTEGYLRVVLADEACARRDQKEFFRSGCHRRSSVNLGGHWARAGRRRSPAISEAGMTAPACSTFRTGRRFALDRGLVVRRSTCPFRKASL